MFIAKSLAYIYCSNQPSIVKHIYISHFRIHMKEITFKAKKKDHFYAVRNEKGQLVLLQEPKPGDKVFEFAAVAGG